MMDIWAIIPQFIERAATAIDGCVGVVVGCGRAAVRHRCEVVTGAECPAVSPQDYGVNRRIVVGFPERFVELGLKFERKVRLGNETTEIDLLGRDF